jgi:transcriptional regulator with XRE-family HTH domain
MNGGKKLKAWLKANGKRALDVCIHCNTYPNHVSNVMSGKTTPSLEMAFKIEEFTGGEVKAKDFTGGAVDEEDEERAAA